MSRDGKGSGGGRSCGTSSILGRSVQSAFGGVAECSTTSGLQLQLQRAAKCDFATDTNYTEAAATSVAAEFLLIRSSWRASSSLSAHPVGGNLCRQLIAPPPRRMP
ncbi:GM11785 [Drosophila sechellia]|uniref:GM11785 n=1 Tax=Drosophila sechellia TaxID=7238 RepID=B4IH94_DROSE|nr:GM11785 [Drosophila sechellia]